MLIGLTLLMLFLIYFVLYTSKTHTHNLYIVGNLSITNISFRIFLFVH